MLKRPSTVFSPAFAVLAWLLATTGATATTYHVAPSGKDGNDGSQSAPWATLQHAAGKVRAGDTVVVTAGRYAGFDLRTAGTKDRPITFRAEKGAVINARNPLTPDGINIENAGHVVIDGFAIEKTPRTGIRVVKSPGVVVRNNSIDGCGVWGILTGFVDDLLLENNVTSRSIKEHGIYVSYSCNRAVVRGNTAWGNSGCGIHLNGDASGGGNGIITRVVIENNTLYDNGKRNGGAAINGDGVQDSAIQNNLLYNNHASGISLYRDCGGSSSKNNLIINNTVVMATDGRWALNIQNSSTGNIALNNIFLNRHSFRGSINISPDSLEGFRSDYNVLTDRFSTDGGESILNLDSWRSAHRQDKHSVVALPTDVFKDIEANNYHLSPSSPALDVGTAEKAPKTDREGNPRPRGKGVDIGAYESGETAPARAPAEGPTPRGPEGSPPSLPQKSENPAPPNSPPVAGKGTVAEAPRKETIPSGTDMNWILLALFLLGAVAVFGAGIGLALVLVRQRRPSTGRRRRNNRRSRTEREEEDEDSRRVSNDRERRRSRGGR